jgi:hypothetical protein
MASVSPESLDGDVLQLTCPVPPGSSEAEVSALERRRHSYQLRLTAETSIATQAALVGGFSITIVPGVVQIASPGPAHIVALLCLITSAALNLFALLMLGHINWVGLHLLSAHKSNTDAELNLFREFWKNPVSRACMTAARWAFRSSIPCLLSALSIQILWGSQYPVALGVAVAIVFGAIMSAFFFAANRTAAVLFSQTRTS